MQVLRSGQKAAMTEQQLEGAYIRTLLEQMDGEGMSKRVWADGLGDATTLPSESGGFADSLRRDMILRVLARE
jgi:hypothetical protein